jgi:hypothetical protein
MGMVMISITNKTSITSMSGVVLISIITSGSSLALLFPIFMAMVVGVLLRFSSGEAVR